MIAAVIPTLYRPPTLAPLMEILETDGVHVVLIDTAGREPAIYRWWNEGVVAAREAGATAIAVLNDDIALTPGSVPYMADVLRLNPDLGIVYPDPGSLRSLPTDHAVERTEGLWHSSAGRGMVGWCFMIRADLPVAFDERYRWWAGDDAFEESVRRAGMGVGCALGLTVEHHSSHSADKRWDELYPLICADRAIWYGPDRWA